MKVRQAEVLKGVFRGFSPIPSRETRGEREAFQNSSKKHFSCQVRRWALREINQETVFVFLG